jgi:TP901 family phage tail tape measure protein
MAQGFDLGSAYGRIIIDGSGIDGDIQAAKSGLSAGLDSLSSGLTNVGGALTGLAAPVAAAFGAGVLASNAFSQSVTNTGAVLNLTQDEIAALRNELLTIGGDTVAGPQAVADAYYDIAGGVADASTHMAILDAAIATSEAGNASLTGTTSALIAVMNSYKFSADQASFASDVLTRTVGMGVGTMDEFASALPMVTGLAQSLGIEFDDLGAMTAYLTTQGNTASTATTQLAAMMTALLKPNEKALAALAELGFTSGEAAIEQLGLVGAIEAISGTQTAATDGLAAILGTTEALRGATSLAGDDFDQFIQTFVGGVTDATSAARAIQLTDPAQQFALLQSSMSEMAITAGQALVPALITLVGQVRPVIDSVIAWVRENPELTAQIGLLAGALAVAGPALMVVGGAIGAIGTIIGAVVSPIGIAIAAVGALVAAYLTNFGGVRDFIDTNVRPIIMGFFDALGQVWATIQPGLAELYTWFTETALPAVATFITDTVAPAVQDFVDILEGLWRVVQPALASLYDWFVTTGLPAMQIALNAIKVTYIDPFITALQNIWTSVSPGLTSLVNWFRDTFQYIGTTYIQPVITAVGDIITKVQDALNALRILGGGAHNPNLIDQNSQGLGLPTIPMRDSGGPGIAGMPYLIGPPQQGNELFIPSSNGTFVPDFAALLEQIAGQGGDGGLSIGNVNVYASNPTEAGDLFMRRVNELYSARGLG